MAERRLIRRRSAAVATALATLAVTLGAGAGPATAKPSSATRLRSASASETATTAARQTETVTSHDVRVVETERLAKDVANPRVVNRNVGTSPVDVIAPLLVRRAQPCTEIGIDVVEPLREDVCQNLHRQEGAGCFDEREPLGVVSGDAHERTIDAGTR